MLLILLAIAAVMLFGGVVCIWRGLWPRRRGDAPFCRACGYNLSGLDRSAPDARCSECGRVVSYAKAVVIGTRTRRPTLAACGVALFVLVIGGVGAYAYAVIQQVNWYPHMPTLLVKWGLSLPDDAAASGAMEELIRRAKTGVLSESARSDVIGLALAEHAAEPGRRAVAEPATDFLFQAYVDDALSEDQSQRLLSQLVRVELRVRAQAPEGGVVPYAAYYGGRWPAGFRASVYHEVWIDGERIDGTYCGGTSSGGGCSGSVVRCPAIGKHRLGLKVTTDLEPGGIGGAPALSVLPDFRREFTLEAPFEVVPAEAMTLAATRSREMDQWLMHQLRVDEFSVYGEQIRCSFVHDGSSPIGAAWEVLLRTEHGIVSFGSLTIEPDATGKYKYFYSESVLDAGSVAVGDVADVLLIPSREAALWTVDLVEYYDGGLIFEGMTLADLNERYLSPKDSLGPTPRLLTPEELDATRAELAEQE